MKLGNKVKFKKYLKKSRENIILEDWTEEEIYEKQGEVITLEKFKTVELERELTGIIAGKRHMTEMCYMEIRHNDCTDEDYLHTFDRKDIDLYLVAINLRGFHRVPIEWLELV